MINIKNKNRIGERNVNNRGSLMEIVEYKNFHNILVEFIETGTKVPTKYNYFKNGATQSPYDRTVFGIGYMGEGKYKGWDNGKNTSQYNSWHDIFRRCYSVKYHEKEPTYKGCDVCKEWYNFQTYGKWYDENYYEVEGERIHLDKDILVKGNKVYSPETCVFVPQRINNLFTKTNSKRGILPIGVSFIKGSTKYRAQCNTGKKLSNNKKDVAFLGEYNNAEEAFFAYKTYKEKYIKSVAEEYKDRIPAKLYNALITYEVEITD